MIFNVTKTSDWGKFKPIKVKIDSLQDLIKFIKTNEGQVVISIYPDYLEDGEVELEIYDDYRE